MNWRLLAPAASGYLVANPDSNIAVFPRILVFSDRDRTTGRLIKGVTDGTSQLIIRPDAKTVRNPIDAGVLFGGPSNSRERIDKITRQENRVYVLRKNGNLLRSLNHLERGFQIRDGCRW